MVYFNIYLYILLLVAQMVKNSPARQRPGFYPWVGKIPLEKGIATHSRMLAWRIPWTEEPGGLHSMGSKELNVTE